MKKICAKCQEEKLIDDFYKNVDYSGGYNARCKECLKEYRKAFAKTAAGKVISKKARKTPKSKATRDEYRKKNSSKISAIDAVGYAIKTGKLMRPSCCEVCGNTENVLCHHDDYAKQLEVRGLCPLHHNAWHRKNGEGLNGKRQTVMR